MHAERPEGGLEVFVVDGLSDDGTIEILEGLCVEFHDLSIIINEKRTTPFALNLGINRSNAEYLIILGAHSEVSSDFFFQNLKVFKDHPMAWCVGGKCENIYTDDTSKAIGAAMSSSFGVGNVRFRTGGEDGYVDTVAFGAYKSSVFESIGLFDESLTRNQDDELNFRIVKAGGLIYYSSSIRYKYFVRASFEKLFRQYFQYGYWKVIVNKKHSTITTLRQIVPALFVLYLILQCSLIFILTSAYLGLILITLYMILGIYFSLGSGASPMKVLRAFIILHLSYGLGYWKALILGGRFRKEKITR